MCGPNPQAIPAKITEVKAIFETGGNNLCIQNRKAQPSVSRKATIAHPKSGTEEAYQITYLVKDIEGWQKQDPKLRLQECLG